MKTGPTGQVAPAKTKYEWFEGFNYFVELGKQKQTKMIANRNYCYKI